MTDFSKALRGFVAEQIAQPGEHKRVEMAAAFLDEHSEVAAEHLRDLAERSVARLIKELCDESEADPLPIFSGFPMAIAVSPGVVKATINCTLADLGAGLAYRADNVRNAQDKLRAFRESMARFEALRTGDEETVGECTERLRLQLPTSEGGSEAGASS